MKVKAIIFDVDGVLLDSVPYHFKAWKKLFKSHGVNFTFEDYLEKVNGLPRIAGVKNILPHLREDELEKLAQKKQDYLLQMVQENPPKPLSGTIALLKSLRKKGYKIAAASSSKNAPAFLKNAGLTPFLDEIVSGNDFTRSKPDPEIFLTAAKKLAVEPEACAVVEDAFAGIQAAENGKMKTIGLTSSNDKNLGKSANLVIESLKDQKAILEFIERTK